MSNPVSETEFYANATLGFREWHFGLGVGECEPPLLEGLMKYGFHQPHYCWNLEETNYAECLHFKFKPHSFSEEHGEVPKMGCSCGFYAHGRRDEATSETTAHRVAGIVAGWGNLELHERGFKCGVAKILAFFAPDPRRISPYHRELAQEKWAVLSRRCIDNDIPLLPADSLRDEEEVRRYAYERDLVLLEDQLSFRDLPLADTGS